MNKILLTLTICSFLGACSFSENSDSPYPTPWEPVQQVPQVSVSTDSPYLQVKALETTKPQPPEVKEELVEPKDEHQPQTNIQPQDLLKDLAGSDVQVRQDRDKINIVMPVQSVFGTNQMTVQPSFEPFLSAIAKQIREHRRTMVYVIGYTDNEDSYLANKALSLRHANAVADFLRQHGINSERILTDGLGSQDPIASNASVSGRYLNRRVEINLISIQ